MTKLAVFDWNGTLFDDLPANLDGANNTLALFDVPPVTTEEYQDRFNFPILHFYVNCGIHTDDYLARHEEAAEAFLSVYEREALKCELRDGAIDFLKWLRAQNVHVMILSNHIRPNVENQLRRFGILELFDGISCNEVADAAMISSLNKQERLQDYMSGHNFDLSQSFIIGDSLEEPHIAKQIGLTSINITGGCLSEKRLAAHHPDHLVHDFHETRNILQNLWGLPCETAAS